MQPGAAKANVPKYQNEQFDKIFKNPVWSKVVAEHRVTPILICRNTEECRIDLHLGKSCAGEKTNKLGFMERVGILKAVKASLLSEGFIDKNLPDLMSFRNFKVNLAPVRGPIEWSSPAKDVTAVVFGGEEYQLVANHENGVFIKVPNFEAIVYTLGEVEMLDAY